MPGGQKGNVALEKKMRKQQDESQPFPGPSVSRMLSRFPTSPTQKDKKIFTCCSYHKEVARALHGLWGFACLKAFGEWGCPDHAEVSTKVKLEV